MAEAEEHLRSLLSVSPWEGDYDNDWCHFCMAQPDYDEEPWSTHRDGCVWAMANEWAKTSRRIDDGR